MKLLTIIIAAFTLHAVAHGQAISRIEVKQTGQDKEGYHKLQVGTSVMQPGLPDGVLEVWYIYKPEMAVSVGESEKLVQKYPFNFRTPGTKLQDVRIPSWIDWVVFIRGSDGRILGYKSKSAFAEAAAIKIAQKSGGLPGKSLGASR